jgi:hypothetical protein
MSSPVDIGGNDSNTWALVLRTACHLPSQILLNVSDAVSPEFHSRGIAILAATADAAARSGPRSWRKYPVRAVPAASLAKKEEENT